MSFTGIDTKVLKNGDPEPSPPAPGVFRIYYMRFCPFAQRALIYAAKKGIPAEIINIHLKDKPEWYFNKHYKGQVPTLEHDGKTVIESAVIPEYLDDIFPETRILPTDPYEKVQQKLLLEKISVISLPIYGIMMDKSGDASVREQKVAALVKAFEDIEKYLEHDFYSGNNPGFVDYLIYPNVERGLWIANILPNFPLDSTNFPGPAKYPKLTKWFSRMQKLPEIIAASQPLENGIGFFKGYIAGEPNFDYGL